jgi:O-antigen/teichoic acid export membrane protein
MRSQTESPESSLAERFTHGAFWSLTGTVVSRISAFLGAIIVARFLGKEGFGELAMIQSTIGLLGTIAGFGIGATATKYVAEFRGKDRERTGRIVALTYLVSWVTGGIVGLFCLWAAPWLAAKIINAAHLTPEVRLASVILLVSAGFGPQAGILFGFQAFRSIARINCWQGMIGLALTALLVVLAGLRGVILALILVAVLGGILSLRALGEEYRTLGVRPNFPEAWGERGILGRFFLPSSLATGLHAFVIWAANAILVNQPNGYAEMGIFNAAIQFQMLITFLPGIIGTVAVPLLSEIHGLNDRRYFSEVVNLNLRTIWTWALLFGFLTIAFSSWLISLYGSQFQNGRRILVMMVCVAIMNVANNTVGQALTGAGRMWAGFFMNLGWGLVLLASALFLVPRLGALGLALAYILAYSFHTLWTLWYTAIKFSRSCVQYSHLLSILTFISFLFGVGIGKIPETIVISTSLLLSLIIAFFGWHLLSLQGRQKILEIVSRRIS